MAFRPFFKGRPYGAWLVFAAAVSLDPLLQAYIRFWLSDIAALVCFAASLCALNQVLRSQGRGAVAASLAAYAVLVFLTILTRIAYAPIEFLTALLCALFSARPAFRGTRLRLAAACLVVPLCVAAFTQANGIVAMDRFRGHAFLNKVGPLLQLGVFAPALHWKDFTRAGVPLSRAHFAAMHLGRYAGREQQVWGGDPNHIDGVLFAAAGSTDPYDTRFEALSGAVLKEGLLHHPMSFALVYAATFGLYLLPAEYAAHFADEMGFGRDLPDFVPAMLHQWTDMDVKTTVTSDPSPMTEILHNAVMLYPLLFLAGIAAACVLLFRRASSRSDHLAATALVATLLVTPLFSHVVKARYMLPAVFLSYATVTLAVWPQRPPMPQPPARQADRSRPRAAFGGP